MLKKSKRSSHAMFGLTPMISAGLLLMFSVGCASQGDLDASRNKMRAQDQRIIELEQEVDSWKSQADAADSAARKYVDELSKRDAIVASLRAGLTQAQQDNDHLLEELNSMNPVMLPAEVSSALEEIASKHADLMEFDAKRGMLRLASDLTFDLGSDAVRSDAVKTLNEVAKVLKSTDLTTFDIRVVGHTDNVPIRRAATKAKHPTNLHLSVDRAISVQQILAKAGIDPHRMSVMGWGEYRPIVPNAAKGGAKANRRVEIFLVPTTYEAGAISSESNQPEGNSVGDNAEPVSGKKVGPAGNNSEPIK